MAFSNDMPTICIWEELCDQRERCWIRGCLAERSSAAVELVVEAIAQHPTGFGETTYSYGHLLVITGYELDYTFQFHKWVV
jgi:hypothetical protein